MDNFVSFPRHHYAHCSQYVPDMESDIRNMFDPEKDGGLEFTDLQGFVAYKDGKTVGRILGIINHKANEKWKVKNVRFGYIEFIDDQEVSAALLDAVGQWGREKGMDCIEGPLGITDFDKEGMLVEDFDLDGSMTAIYNYDYYPQHMEALGFEKEADWQQVRINIPKEIPAKYARVAKYAREMVGLKLIKVTARDIWEGGYAKKIFDLFNEAYAPLFGFSSFTSQQARDFLKKYVPLLDLDLVPVVENDKGEMVGMAVTVPSYAKALKKSRGRLWPFGWLYLLPSLIAKRSDSTEMLLIAVRPDYQGLGVNAMFFDDLIPIYNKKGIKWAETGPQLEYNVREQNQWKPLNPQTVKRRRCYKKELTTEQKKY